MGTFWQDFRYSLRSLLKAPGFTLIAVLTLALGIGANTTIFSWINATLLNPIPGLAHSSDVVSLSLGATADNPFPFTFPDYVQLREHTQSFSGLMAFNSTFMNLTGGAKPQRVWATMASANYFDVLGVRPILGRGFLPSEDQTPNGAPVAVISYRFWETHFGKDPNIVGQTIHLNQHPYTIVGVTPPVFQGSQTGLRVDLWVPIMMEAQVNSIGDLLHDNHYFWVFLLGRLKPGVAPGQAQQEMTVLMQPMVRQYPDEHRGHEAVTLFPLWRAPFGANGYLSLLLPMLLAISGVVLLLACANVANLLLVRSVARRREIAIRLSLGASRWRLLRQFLVESLVLAMAGGAIALLFTIWTSGTMMRFLPRMDFPISIEARVDRSVLFAALVLAFITALVFGIVPALRASREPPLNALKEETGNASGGRRKARLASGLVVAQVSLSLLLLVCAGLFIRSFVSAQRISPGFNEDNVLLASYDLFSAGYSQTQGIEFNRQLLGKLEALPGIQSVSLSTWVPLGLGGGSTSVKPEGYVSQPHESMETNDALVSPSFLRTMQIPLAEGREFTPQDTRDSQRVAIVNQEFVDRYWPHQEALGKRLESDLTYEWFTVVGVARNSKYFTLNEPPRPFVFLPLSQVYRSTPLIFARVPGDPLAFAPAIEKTIHEQNADLPIFDVTTLKSRVQLASFGQRIAGTFVGAFGLLSLILAAVGIYGVLAYTTRQRTHEFGIRMALGAQPGDVLRLVLRQGLFLTLLGLAAGLVASFVLTRYLSSMLLGVTPTDALTFSSVAIVLCAAALAACYIPARRATRVDPLVALRYE